VTVDLPLATLNQVSGEEFGWQVPGLREELVTELIRSLPKQLRRNFVPAPDTARAVLARLGPAHGDLLDTLAAELAVMGGVTIPREAWDLSRLPAHLRITFRVVDSGRVLAAGKDLGALRQQLRPRLQQALTEAAGGITRSGLRSWDLGSLPRTVTAGQVRAYPALADAGDAVDIRLFETEAEAAEAMWLGTRRLILLQVPAGVRSVASRLPVNAKLAMSRHPYPSTEALLADCAACAADQVITEAGGPAWDAEGFAALLAAAQSRLGSNAATVVSAVARALTEAQDVANRLGSPASPVLGPALADMRAQLAALIYPGFVADTGARRLPDLVRYLRAIGRRLEKAPADPGRDADRMMVVHRVADAYRRAVADRGASARGSADARAVRWMIEELRVSLFAQMLGTPVPVSERRIQAALDKLAS
jgi:ATP-dependent helicase HrpA